MYFLSLKFLRLFAKVLSRKSLITLFWIVFMPIKPFSFFAYHIILHPAIYDFTILEIFTKVQFLVGEIHHFAFFFFFFFFAWQNHHRVPNDFLISNLGSFGVICFISMRFVRVMILFFMIMFIIFLAGNSDLHAI